MIERIARKRTAINTSDVQIVGIGSSSKPISFIPPENRSQYIVAKMKLLNCCPEELLMHIVNNDANVLDCAPEELDIKFRAACARELLKYTYPTLKSVEVSGPGGEAINLDSKTRQKRIKELLLKAYGEKTEK